MFCWILENKSNNKGMIQYLQSLNSQQYALVQLIVPDLGEIPLFNQDLQKNKQIPTSVIRLRQLVKRLKGVIFCTPQYNGCITGILKNAFDWVSRKYPNEESPMKEKKAAIISASYVSQGQIADCKQMGQYLNVSYHSESFYVNLKDGDFTDGQLTSSTQQEQIRKWYKGVISYFSGK